VENDSSLKDYQNISNLIGTIISARLATLYELRTIYSLEDAMDMFEAYIVPKFNEWKEAKKLESKR